MSGPPPQPRRRGARVHRLDRDAALRVHRAPAGAFHVAALTAFANAELLAVQAAATDAVVRGAREPERPVPPASWRPAPARWSRPRRGPTSTSSSTPCRRRWAWTRRSPRCKAGKRVALANKETLVIAGELAAAACARSGGEIVPVDSRAFPRSCSVSARRDRRDVRRLIITASGGPFRTWTPDAIGARRSRTPSAIPTWSMGRKITVDSATLANKALEVIEAHFLFGIPVRPHRGGGASAERGALDGGVRRRQRARADGRAVDGAAVLYALTHPERVRDDGVPRFDPVALRR